MAISTLFGAEREPKDRPGVPQVLAERSRFFDEAIRFSGNLKALSSALRSREKCWMEAKELNEHGSGLDVQGFALRSEEVD